MNYDPWHDALLIVGFFAGLSFLLVLMVYLETTLDKPIRPPRPSTQALIAAGVRDEAECWMPPPIVVANAMTETPASRRVLATVLGTPAPAASG